MKKYSILVLGGYGTVGSVATNDLINSGYQTVIAGRNEEKMKKMITPKNNPLLSYLVVDLNDEKSLMQEFAKYDVILNCLEYTFNKKIIQICADIGVHYVDLGDDYAGIKNSISHNGDFSKKNKIACLGAGSAPGIINTMIAHIAKNKEKIATVKISFSDILYKKVENMLPFNFTTVVEEILDDALIFENGKYDFAKGMSKSFDMDFGEEFGKQTVYATNHDETYSIPKFLENKGIQNVYFVMKHDDVYLDIVPKFKQFGLLDTEAVKFQGNDIIPRDFVAEIMKKFLPRNFESDDKEMLFAEIDNDTVAVINYSVDGVPAGIMNTGIGASLITQYLVSHQNTIKSGVTHPEFFMDSDWLIDELKKRNFEIQINQKTL